MKKMGHLRKGATKASMRQDLKGIENIIKSHIGCMQTVPDNPMSTCASNPLIDIKTANNVVFIPTGQSSGAKIGRWWQARAFCSASEKSVIVEVRSEASGQVRKDPLSGKDLQWDRIFQNEKICEQAFNPPDIGCHEVLYKVGPNSFIEGQAYGKYIAPSGGWWGIDCVAPYTRTGCVIGSYHVTNHNLSYSKHGCRASMSTYQTNTNLGMTCCRHGL